jgi:hypothetical protein
MSSIDTASCASGWRKARRSIGNGECVEVAPADGKILVRDSKLPHAAMLAYPVGAWRSFVSSAKTGALDGTGRLYPRQVRAVPMTVTWILQLVTKGRPLPLVLIAGRAN